MLSEIVKILGGQGFFFHGIIIAHYTLGENFIS